VGVDLKTREGSFPGAGCREGRRLQQRPRLGGEKKELRKHGCRQSRVTVTLRNKPNEGTNVAKAKRNTRRGRGGEAKGINIVVF